MDDHRIIDLLQDALGVTLLKRRVGEYLESLPGENIDGQGKPIHSVPFKMITHHICQGYFVDSDDRVIGLALCNLHLKSIPSQVARLTRLQKLNMANNDIQDLPDEIVALPELRDVQLAFNKIQALRPSILDSRMQVTVGANYNGIVLFDNPLESPPREIIERGPEAIRDYFSSLEEAALPLEEVKLLLVGDGGAGKTCLVNRLLARGFDPHESQTQGISIDPWVAKSQGRTIKVHLWDFGGQEIMHATHQFFLSERSLYILVLDGRKEEDPEYWLKHIQSFGGTSPVIVVLNKMDENLGFDVNRRFLTSKYVSIVDFFQVSCKTNRGIPSLRKALVNALQNIEITRTRWPKSWLQVKTHLESMDEPFVSYEQYMKLCGECGIHGDSNSETLVTFLHDLGVVVHFADFRLRDTHVLEPRWLTGAVYRIINSNELAKRKGIIALAEVSNILSRRTDGFRYPRDKHPYIVDIMMKFELCYAVDDQTILVPDLLQVQEPAIEFNDESALCLRIEFDFLPRSVIPRFIVRKHHDIKDMLCWRSGVVLEDRKFGATAVVRADIGAKHILVSVSGQQAREYLTVIRTAFLEINRSFEKLSCSEKIPLPDDSAVSISYSHLKRLEREGILECYPDGAKHSYSVNALLGTVQVPTQRTEKEFVELLRRVLSENDTEDLAAAKANDILMLQPNFMGLGIDINALIKRVLGRRKRWRG